MATEKGKDFINRYKDTDCLRSSWELMYKKQHITLEEFVEYANLTEEEKAEYGQINISLKSNEELTKENEQLWETIEFLLKNTGFIPAEGV